MKLSPRYDLIIVGALALSVRLIYVFQLADTLFFSAPIIDAEYHDAWAREILRLGIGHEGVFFRAPLYPYFLALIYHLFDGSYLAARIAQGFIGVGAALLTYLLAGALTRNRTIALMSGIGVSLYGMLVYYDGELLVETLFIPLLLAACLAYAYARRKPAGGLLLSCGLLWGLAAITRPTALMILPLLIIDLLTLRQSSPLTRRSSNPLKHIVFILLGLSLPILPVTWHNWHDRGDRVLIASQGGINFYLGNNSQADGLHAFFPGYGATWDVPYISYQAHQAEGQTLKPSEVSSYYSRLAWNFIFKHPLQAGKLWLKKLGAFWNKLEVSNNRDLYFFQGETTLMPYLRLWGFGLVGPLGLLGWWVGWRRRILPWWFLGIIPIYTLSVIAFFITARFRAPVIPFLMICAALGLQSLIIWSKPFWNRQRLALLALLTVFGLFVNTNPWGFQRENPAHSYFALANAYLKAENYSAAQLAYEQALQADSTYPQVHLNLGVLAYQQGDVATAEREYRRELEINPQNAKAHNNLGALAFRQKRFGEAAQHYQSALELQPYYDDARVNLAQTHFQQGLRKAEAGDYAQAVELFYSAVELEDQNPLFHYNLSLALGCLGQQQKARFHLEHAVTINPNFKEAQELLQRLRAAETKTDTTLRR